MQIYMRVTKVGQRQNLEWGRCIKYANTNTNTGDTNTQKTNTCVVRRSTVETTHMGEVSEAAGRRI